MAVFVDNQGKSWYLLDDDDQASGGGNPSAPSSGMSPDDLVNTLEAPASSFAAGPSMPYQEAPPPLPPPTHAQQTQAQEDAALTQQFMNDNPGAPQMSASPAQAAAHVGLPPAAAAGPGGMTPMQQIEAFAAMRPPPMSSGPAMMELTSSTTTTNTVHGRDKKLAAADVAAMDAAGASGDTAIVEAGKAKDQRTADAAGIEIQGSKDAEERYRNEVIDQQLAKQAAVDEVGRLNEELKRNDESLDPDAFVKKMPAGKKVGITILAMLNGAFQSLAGQKGNLVLEALDNAINENIEKQKAEIAAGRTRIGNDIAEFRRKGYDAATAERLARDRANSAVDQLVTLEAKRKGVEGENASMAEQLVAQRKEQRDSERRRIMAETESRIQTSTVKTMAQKPVAGAGGVQQLKTALELDQALEKSGYTKPERAAYLKSMGMSPPTGESAMEQAERHKKETVSEHEGKASDAKKSLLLLGAKAGLVRGPDGQWTTGEGLLPPALTEKLASTFSGGFTTEPIQDQLRAAAEAYGRFRSGGVIGPTEVPNFMQQLGADTLTRAQLASRLNAAESTISAQLAAEERNTSKTRAGAGFTPVQ